MTGLSFDLLVVDHGARCIAEVERERSPTASRGDWSVEAYESPAVWVANRKELADQPLRQTPNTFVE